MTPAHAELPAFPEPSALARHWAIDPAVCYLNHGSFGGTPRVVLAAQRAVQDAMEAEAVRFFVEDLVPRLDRSREALAAVVKCGAECIAPITNATQGVATVFANLRLNPGDEVLVTSHEYPACRNIANFTAKRAGAKVVVASLPFPCGPDIGGPDAVVDAVLNAVTDRTRVALISHVTSGSGMILPIERIVPVLEGRGVRVLVDGAHAIGMLPLDLAALNPSYYVTNCHKWLCTPKGSAMLYVRRELREGFRPLVLSNNAENPKPGREQFLTEFDYCGTSDQSGFMVIPEAIEFLESLMPGGLEGLMRHNRAMALEGRRVICEALRVSPPCPEEMVGSIATILMPTGDAERARRLAARPSKHHDALQDVLIREYGLQMPVWGVTGPNGDWLRCCRVAAQAYNSPEQYRYAAAALARELAREAAL
jgi:isopenicillin-N epimerase